MDKPTNESVREPYEPPAIEDIPLYPEEQLLAGCKAPGGFGPLSGGVNNNFCALCRLPSAS